MFVEYNPNPVGRRVGDCAVRAVSAALGMDWEDAYLTLAVNGFLMGDMPSADSVWAATLRQRGFKRHNSPADCLDCYTLSDFAEDHPTGVYVAKTDNHVDSVVTRWEDTPARAADRPTVAGTADMTAEKILRRACVT